MADNLAGAVQRRKEPILRVENLVKYFPLRRGSILKKKKGAIMAVDGISFELWPGETLGLVGESGCGKSTVARTLMRLEEPTKGHAYFEGQDILALPKRDLQAVRLRIQMIFQDPYASLNSRMTVGQIVTEPLQIHPGIVPKSEHTEYAVKLLERVGLSAHDAARYPHEFSGGQRQRIGIARALMLNPAIILCDEPVSALDVSIRAQIINLLEDIQSDLGVAYLFIAHDLSVVRHISDRVAVMYLGRIVEFGNEEEIYEQPTHPYTQSLLSAVPIPDPGRRGKQSRIILEGEVPSPAEPPSGCNFRTRCWKARTFCAEEDPDLLDRLGHGHPSACHFPELMPNHSHPESGERVY
jgi:oligopeptide/dipeptide ABC transporter ATP-binding protein